MNNLIMKKKSQNLLTLYSFRCTVKLIKKKTKCDYLWKSFKNHINVKFVFLYVFFFIFYFKQTIAVLYVVMNATEFVKWKFFLTKMTSANGSDVQNHSRETWIFNKWFLRNEVIDDFGLTSYCCIQNDFNC